MTPPEEIAALKAENAALREQIAVLVARVQELEARLAKDSHNSGKPPSSDGLARKTKSLRRRSGKKPGGQLGHRGDTLRLMATADELVEHRPGRCPECQVPLDAAPVVLRERRQVRDLPTMRLVVREHQAVHVRCPACHLVSVGAFPDAAPSRAQYGPRLRALADLFGASPSTGTLVSWVQQSATILAPVEAHIKQAVQRVPVLHNDETGVRQAGTLAWAHVASTARLTH